MLPLPATRCQDSGVEGVRYVVRREVVSKVVFNSQPEAIGAETVEENMN